MQNGISCRCYKIKFMENREFIPNATNLWQTEKKSPPLTASTVSSAETHKMFRNMLPNHRKRTEFFSNLPIYAKKHRNIHSNSDRITQKNRDYHNKRHFIFIVYMNCKLRWLSTLCLYFQQNSSGMVGSLHRWSLQQAHSGKWCDNVIRHTAMLSSTFNHIFRKFIVYQQHTAA